MSKKSSKKRARGPLESGANRSKVQFDPKRVPDKQTLRAPRRPEAARNERSGRSGRLKRRLGG